MDCIGLGIWKCPGHINPHFQNHFIITVTAHDRHGFLNHQRLDCLFSSFFCLTSKKASKPELLSLCQGNHPVTDGLPSQENSNVFPCYDVIMNILFLTLFRRCVCRSKVNLNKSKPTDAIQQLMERLDNSRETEKTLTGTLPTLTSKASTPGQSAKAAWGAWMADMVPHIHDWLFSEFMRNSFSSLMHDMDELKKIREQE